VKRAFTLIELLIIIAIIALLMGVLLPALGKAREQAKVVAVNAELYNIGLALEMYMRDNNGKYPPTREDCMLGEHYHQLPKELVERGYLPAPPSGTWMASDMEDRFNKGYTYKYRSVGELIFDRNRIHSYLKAKLWVPDGFPEISSAEEEKGQWYKEAEKSPVKWVLFSLGPNFDEQWIREIVKNRYPVPKEIWYTPKQRKGFIVRMQLKNGAQIGSFEGGL
jgi:hypothetical protein